MQNSDKLKSLLLALLIAAIAGLVLYFWFFQEKPIEVSDGSLSQKNDLNTNNNEAQDNKNLDLNKNLVCHENPKYFVVVNKILTEVGSNFLVKYKMNQDQIIFCDYFVEENDFEIKNEWAEYFFALENNFLILDSGTDSDSGTGRNSVRKLIVYDLDSQKKIYEDTYFGVTEIKNNKITYWTKSETKITKNNCPKLDEYLSYGGGAAIHKKIILDLTNLTKKDLGESRCFYIE